MKKLLVLALLVAACGGQPPSTPSLGVDVSAVTSVLVSNPLNITAIGVGLTRGDVACAADFTPTAYMVIRPQRFQDPATQGYYLVSASKFFDAKESGDWTVCVKAYSGEAAAYAPVAQCSAGRSVVRATPAEKVEAKPVITCQTPPPNGDLDVLGWIQHSVTADITDAYEFGCATERLWVTGKVVNPDATPGVQYRIGGSAAIHYLDVVTKAPVVASENQWFNIGADGTVGISATSAAAGTFPVQLYLRVPAIGGGWVVTELPYKLNFNWYACLPPPAPVKTALAGPYPVIGTTAFGVRYRSFANTGGREIYEGVGDLGQLANRVDSEYVWQSGTTPVAFTFDVAADKIYGSSGGTVGALASELATTAGRWRWRLAM